ncbi:unnamed protein product [Dibothriocephalus latus]|uniref:Gcp-like domain-containing protein n=1 Tax=Dibothriocephalus latus TaxID=60516 RepID=A0A3P7RS16_DIBLA|nr:unnamed protein product [Dibothriocephalus latus]
MRLSWLNNGQFADCAGGQAIEILARDCPEGLPGIQLPSPRGRDRDCDFSFSGIHVAADRLLKELEQSKGKLRCFYNGYKRQLFICFVVKDTDGSTRQQLDPTQIAAVCASVQTAVTRHLCRRLQRAVEFCAREKLLPVSLPSSETLACGNTAMTQEDSSRPAIVRTSVVA